jgi:hypothetical protein
VITPERIEYWNMDATVMADGVRMDIIVPFSVYSDTDDVVVPEISDKDGNTFAMRVLKILGVVMPPDVIDDNKTDNVKKETK